MSPTFLSDLTGPVGPMGPVNPSSAPADTAVGGWIATTGSSDTKTALAAFTRTVIGLIPALTDSATKAANAAILTAQLTTNSKKTIPAGRFATNPVTLVGPLEIKGEGADLSTLMNDNGTVLRVSGPHLNLSEIAISSYGGGTTIVQTASINQSTWDKVALYQLGAGYSIWDNAGFEYVNMRISNFYSHHSQTATVPSWKLVGAGGIINDNVWEKGRPTYSGNYHFWIEATGANFQYANTFRDITFEVCTGGGIRLISNRAYELDNITNWDMASGVGTITLQRHFIYATANANSMPCTGKISRVQRLAGANAANIYDIVLPAGGLGSGTEISQCGNVGGPDPLTIDLVGNSVSVTGGTGMSLLNSAGAAVVNGVLTNIPTIGVGSGWAVKKNAAQMEISDVVNNRATATFYPGIASKDSYALFAAVIGLASSTTALRPTANFYSPGAMWYDTTLGKPIWSNGTVWKDAAGTTV